MLEVEALSLLILELNFTDSRTESVQVEGNYKKLFKRHFVDFFLLNDFRRKGNGSRVLFVVLYTTNYKIVSLSTIYFHFG